MKYRIEYKAPADKIFGVADDYVYGIKELKYIIKNVKYPIMCITKVYTDGAGVDVTSKYIKPLDLCDLMCN